MNLNQFDVTSPVDGRLLATLSYAAESEIERAVQIAEQALPKWRMTPLKERIDAVMAFLNAFAADRTAIAELVTLQMGRPIADADETGFLVEAGEEWCMMAPEKLAKIPVESDTDVTRWMEPYPLGIHFAICAWNYPVAMIAGIVIPALLAGNVVLFKHAPQTALLSDRLNQAAKDAGMPVGVFQALHINHADAEKLIGSGRINSLQFIGSVRGGQAVNKAIGSAFVTCALELGGKDASYVRSDADITKAAEALTEGAFGNSGQSCCSVERVYVHKDRHADLVDAVRSAATDWSVGNPFDEGTALGPVVNKSGGDHIKSHIIDALSKGATRVIEPQSNNGLPKTGTYVAPEILTGVNHQMAIMKDETFGPVLPIMAVESDEQAIALMNDTPFGLTGSIFSMDIDVAAKLGAQLEVGLFLTNRCDHADPHLPWGGMRKSGLGRTEGPTAFDGVTQLRSYHIRKA